jgi:uncharacterized DUF497 family protein
MDPYGAVTRATAFEWDSGNAEKHWISHQVTVSECEQVFFNRPIIAAEDLVHSRHEPRLFVLGHTDADRRLFIALTIRGDRIRVISARDMSRRERRRYDREANRQEEADSQ